MFCYLYGCVQCFKRVYSTDSSRKSTFLKEIKTNFSLLSPCIYINSLFAFEVEAYIKIE